MENKKNKKSPKATKKKTIVPPNQNEPYKIKSELSPSPPSNDNNKSSVIKNNSPKKEENTEKREEKNDLKKSLEEHTALDFEEPEDLDPLFLREFRYLPSIKKEKESSNDRIASSLKKMETGDDMDILNELNILTEFLSMSSERIGYNPNIGKLLEEICKNLSKTYIPEMIINCLQCINYIIDINPSLVSILKKINAISSIMNTITEVEDITCVDHIIKIFEKISFQNSRMLLENKIFESFLVNIFDFMNIYQKKSIMNICYYMTSNSFSLQDYNLYIKPSMNVLINLIFVDDNDERENLFIVEKATNIFYNIIKELKYAIMYELDNVAEKEGNNNNDNNNNNNEKNNQDNIVDEIIKNYNIIENFKLILDKFFLKNSKIITDHLVQNILKTIVLILEISKEGMNKILSNKFLELISEVINNEFISETKENLNNNFNNNNTINILLKRNSSNIQQYKRFSIFSPEFLDILNAFFPTSIDKLNISNNNAKKILKPENKAYYEFFCNNILLPLVDNVMKKSINIILSYNFIRLIFSFINNATKDDIILFLPSKPISQIIIKLLNTKKNSSVNDSVNLIKCLLDKSPDNYIVNFVREGIIENLKNFKPEENLEKKRERIPFAKYGLLFPDDYKRLFKKERERIKRRRRDLLLKTKEKKKNIDNDNDKNILNKNDKDNEDIKGDNNKNDDVIKEEGIIKEKEEIKKLEETIISKEKKEIKLDEDKDEEEEENEQSEKSEKGNEENEDKEKSENNEEDENNDKEDEDDIEEDEEEQEEDEDQDNSDKNEDQPENEEENNLMELEEKFEIKERNKQMSSSPKKEKEEIKKEKSEEKEDKEKEKDKEKEIDKEKDKEKDKGMEKKDKEKEKGKLKDLEILEEALVKNSNFDLIKAKKVNILELLNNKFEKLNEEITGEKEIFTENLLSRKRRFEIKDHISRKNRYKNYDFLEFSETKTIPEKIKELLDNYLTDEKINQFLLVDQNKEKIKLLKIKETLSNYNKEILSPLTSPEDKENYTKEAINILLGDNISLTSFELETSKILLSFCHFLEPEFNSIYNQLKEDSAYKTINDLVKDLKERNIIPESKNINNDIYIKLSKFLNFFSPEKIHKFIALLNESINGMNNTILNLNNRREEEMLLSKTIRINYNEQIFKDKVLKENYNIDESFKTKLCELNTFFLTNKRLALALNDTTSFKMIGITLLATANIPLISNDKFDIAFNFYVEIKQEKKEEIKEQKQIEKKSEDKMEVEKEKEKEKDFENDFEDEDEVGIDMFNDENVEEDEEEIMFGLVRENKKSEDYIKKQDNNNIIENKENNKIEKEKEPESEKNIYIINENTTYKEFIEDYNKKYKDSIHFIQFGLSLKQKHNDTINLSENNNDDTNKIIIEIESDIQEGESKTMDFKKYYSTYLDKNTNEIQYIDFNLYSFIKEYHENIFYNKYIYFSKSLSPSIYLLSLLNLSLINYPKLFPFQKNRKELKKLFYNMKLDLFIFKLSSYPRKILEESFSFLANFISNNKNQELTRFQTRLLSFKTSFFPQYKSMKNLQNYFKHSNPELASKFSVNIRKTMRLKINVEREKIIEHAFNLINDSNFSDYIGYLEFEYKGEIGNGTGPTLEFYTIILDKIKADNNLWYKTTDGSLYPKLLEGSKAYNIKMFRLLGYMIGRAIYDDRLLDIPLSKVFWDRVLDRGLTFESLKYIDENLYKTIQDFINLINQKNEYIKINNIKNIKEINFDDIIFYNNCKLSELDIYFTFPGYDINLKQNGDNILLTLNNLEEYVNLIYDYIFFKGINPLINSFKEGFNMNFDINKMQCFTSQEIEENICGSKEIKWEINNLYENLNPEHGYTKQSKTFNDLIKFMCSLTDAQKKKFLIFSTGCSRLPIGGFKSLSPKLTVVKKYCEEGSNPNDFLPTVMTCQNYLKIPEYSRYDILEKKILMAMEEGCNEFSLS